MSTPVALPVVDTTGWGEASQNPETFSKGGAAARLNEKTVTIVGVSAETRPIGGDGPNAADFKTYVDVAFLADGETEVVEQQYDAGTPEFVRVQADGSALITKTNRISGSTQWAEFLDSMAKAGYKPATTKFAEHVGVRLVLASVEKKYDFTKDGKKISGTTTRLLATKFVGKGAVPSGVAAAQPLVSAAAAPGTGSAQPDGSLQDRLIGGVIDALANAEGNKLKISDLSKTVIKALGTNITSTEKGTAAKTLLDQGFYANVPGVSVQEGGLIAM